MVKESRKGPNPVPVKDLLRNGVPVKDFNAKFSL